MGAIQRTTEDGGSIIVTDKGKVTKLDPEGNVVKQYVDTRGQPLPKSRGGRATESIQIDPEIAQDIVKTEGKQIEQATRQQRVLPKLAQSQVNAYGSTNIEGFSVSQPIQPKVPYRQSSVSPVDYVMDVWGRGGGTSGYDVRGKPITPIVQKEQPTIKPSDYILQKVGLGNEYLTESSIKKSDLTRRKKTAIKEIKSIPANIKSALKMQELKFKGDVPKEDDKELKLIPTLKLSPLGLIPSLQSVSKTKQQFKSVGRGLKDIGTDIDFIIRNTLPVINWGAKTSGKALANLSTKYAKWQLEFFKDPKAAIKKAKRSGTTATALVGLVGYETLKDAGIKVKNDPYRYVSREVIELLGTTGVLKGGKALKLITDESIQNLKLSRLKGKPITDISTKLKSSTLVNKFDVIVDELKGLRAVSQTKNRIVQGEGEILTVKKKLNIGEASNIKGLPSLNVKTNQYLIEVNSREMARKTLKQLNDYSGGVVGRIKQSVGELPDYKLTPTGTIKKADKIKLSTSDILEAKRKYYIIVNKNVMDRFLTTSITKTPTGAMINIKGKKIKFSQIIDEDKEALGQLNLKVIGQLDREIPVRTPFTSSKTTTRGTRLSSVADIKDTKLLKQQLKLQDLRQPDKVELDKFGITFKSIPKTKQSPINKGIQILDLKTVKGAGLQQQAMQRPVQLFSKLKLKPEYKQVVLTKPITVSLNKTYTISKVMSGIQIPKNISGLKVIATQKQLTKVMFNNEYYQSLKQQGKLKYILLTLSKLGYKLIPQQQQSILSKLRLNSKLKLKSALELQSLQKVKQDMVIKSKLDQVQDLKLKLRPITIVKPEVVRPRPPTIDKIKKIKIPNIDIKLIRSSKIPKGFGVGYNVYVIERGISTQANIQRLPYNEAHRLGKDITDNSLSASYRITQTDYAVPLTRRRKLKTGLYVNSAKFRRSKSKKRKNYRIEKAKHRLDSPNEKKEIRAAKLIKQLKAKLKRKSINKISSKLRLGAI